MLAVTVDCDEKIGGRLRIAAGSQGTHVSKIARPWGTLVVTLPTLSAGALSRVLDVGHPPTPVISYQRSKDSFR